MHTLSFSSEIPSSRAVRIYDPQTSFNFRILFHDALEAAKSIRNHS
jgi:hypothetical protein